MQPILGLFDLHGKVALVTGARNLGYYSAQTLAELGAAVVVTTRTAESAARAAESIRGETGARVEGMALEATDYDNWQDVVGRTLSAFGGIDILINNAGGRSPERVSKTPSADITLGFLEDRPVDTWKANLDINITGAFLGCKSVIGAMKKAGGGRIVNIASIDGIVGRDLQLYEGTGLSPTVPDYLASKAAIINLTRGIAVAYARFGIRCNSISPGGFERAQPQEFIRSYSARVPLGRMGRDDTDLKGAVAYLCSAASEYVTGHNLVVDGGWTAW